MIKWLGQKSDYQSSIAWYPEKYNARIVARHEEPNMSYE